MTLKTKSNNSKNSNSNSNNSNNSIVNNDNCNSTDVAEIHSTIKKINNLISFEELRKECLVQSMKEDIKSILNCIDGIKNELAESSPKDARSVNNITKANEYKEAYKEILKDLDDEGLDD